MNQNHTDWGGNVIVQLYPCVDPVKRVNACTAIIIYDAKLTIDVFVLYSPGSKMGRFLHYQDLNFVLEEIRCAEFKSSGLTMEEDVGSVGCRDFEMSRSFIWWKYHAVGLHFELKISVLNYYCDYDWLTAIRIQD